ncbi:hypothetical protein JR316_0006764 [Psilocybe cubensis]|uniref:Uncharacterized protein n=2 Tax=Psilocybe cubensis TaxID=181762 RepID=A0A8H8CEF0_PSICU|nr:hypothetical protein JR316_0006764 [Psilocybe cubensis]KAH9480166.1 hypothetical protein JR316_0006764 [Psilocybe cubensis]
MGKKGKKGAYHGARLEFLLSQKPAFQKATSEKNKAEVLADIQRRFFKRFPLEKPDTWEPTAEELDAVDDDAPDEEPEEPNKDLMSLEDYEKAVEKRKERQALLASRRNKIRRWFKYQYDKDHSVSLSLAEDPYFNLIQQLFGKESKKPRLKTPVNLWRKVPENHDLIEAEIMAMVPAVDVKELAKTRDAVARRLFSSLDVEVQKQWKEIALEQHAKALKEHENYMTEGPSLSPEERQRCIECLTRVMQPVLEAVCKMTGWVSTFMAGGPEPAREGSLSIVSVHAGVTSGPIKMNFGAAERVRIKEHTIPIFTSYVRKCFTAEMRKSVALPKDKGFVPLSQSPNIDKDAVHLVPTEGASKPNQSSIGQSTNVSNPPPGQAQAMDHDSTLKEGRRRKKRDQSDIWDGFISFSDKDPNSSDGEGSIFHATTPEVIPSPPASPVLRSQDTISSIDVQPIQHSSEQHGRQASSISQTTHVATQSSDGRTSSSTQPVAVAGATASITSDANVPLISPQVSLTNVDSAAAKNTPTVAQTPASQATRSGQSVAATLISRVLFDTAGSLVPTSSAAKTTITPKSTAPHANVADESEEVLAPQSSHPSVSMTTHSNRGEVSEESQKVVAKQRGGKRKAIQKNGDGVSKRQKKPEKTKSTSASSGENTTPLASDTNHDNAMAVETPGDATSSRRRSTRSTAVANAPTRPSATIAPEGTVILRTGKTAKKSKFWTYEEVESPTK